MLSVSMDGYIDYVGCSSWSKLMQTAHNCACRIHALQKLACTLERSGQCVIILLLAAKKSILFCWHEYVETSRNFMKLII